MPSAPQIQPLGFIFEEVEKRYGGFVALRGISFAVAPGECVALLGQNGSGKTTLLKIAALLVRPTKGGVKLVGGDRRQIGMVAHSTLAYDELTARENLEFFVKLYGLDEPRARAEDALESVGLGLRAETLVRTFSRGMRQRLAIARALLHSPSLLLLDEPGAGLDREGAAWFAAKLREWRAEGRTILMSTHARTETLDIFTRAVALRGGRIERDTGAGGNPRPLLEAVQAEA